MTAKLRVRYRLPNAATATLRMIDRGQSVQEVISFIARLDRSDLNTLFLDDAELPPDESFDAFYESKDQLFVFSKASTPAMASPLSPHPPQHWLRLSRHRLISRHQICPFHLPLPVRHILVMNCRVPLPLRAVDRSQIMCGTSAKALSVSSGFWMIRLRTT
jgi:hypothetical protein